MNMREKIQNTRLFAARVEAMVVAGDVSDAQQLAAYGMLIAQVLERRCGFDNVILEECFREIDSQLRVNVELLRATK